MPVRRRKDRRRHAVFEMGELDDDEVAELRRDWAHMPVEHRPRFLDAGKE